MVSHRLLLPLSLSLALGCAATPPPVPPPAWSFASASPASGKELRLRSGTRYVQVSLDGDNIYGPNWSLQHGGTYIRGYGVNHQGVQITLKGTRADGNLLNNPLTVDLQPLDNGVTKVGGLMGGGKLSDFKISPTIFQGKLGQCSYDLQYNGTRYEGMSTCSGNITPTSLDLPVAMASWTDLETATVLAIVLGT
jgi:hypothetical protein